MTSDARFHSSTLSLRSKNGLGTTAVRIPTMRMYAAATSAASTVNRAHGVRTDSDTPSSGWVAMGVWLQAHPLSGPRELSVAQAGDVAASVGRVSFIRAVSWSVPLRRPSSEGTSFIQHEGQALPARDASPARAARLCRLAAEPRVVRGRGPSRRPGGSDLLTGRTREHDETASVGAKSLLTFK